MSDRSNVAPLPSATVLLVRDASAGLEVFMVKRHHQIDFATGALVFPGGKVEASDRDPDLAGHCAGVAELGDECVALRAAAIRETFEESGVLLARSRGDSQPIEGERQRRVADRHRAELDAGRRALREIAEIENLELATDLLVPFAHWITPEWMPKRFDTHFFVAAAPPAAADAVHDGREAVDSLWIAPATALADAARGTRTVIFPTRMNLAKLGRSRSVAEALAAARRAPPVTVLPRVLQTPAGPVVHIPAEADYDVTEVPVSEAR